MVIPTIQLLVMVKEVIEIPKKRDKLPVIRKRLGKQSWVPPSKPPPYKEPWLPPSPHLVHKEVPWPPPTRIYGSTTSISQMARVPHAFAEMSSPFMHQSESSPSLEGTTMIKKGGKLYISLKNLKSGVKSSINLKK